MFGRDAKTLLALRIGIPAAAPEQLQTSILPLSVRPRPPGAQHTPHEHHLGSVSTSCCAVLIDPHQSHSRRTGDGVTIAYLAQSPLISGFPGLSLFLRYSHHVGPSLLVDASALPPLGILREACYLLLDHCRINGPCRARDAPSHQTLLRRCRPRAYSSDVSQ